MPRFAGALAAFALAWLLVLAPAIGFAQPLQPVPKLAARVTDLTGTLSAADRASLESELESIERRKGAQVAILMVRTTAPEPIEAYSIRVAEQWKIGRGAVDGKRVDDGVIVLVAKDDRAVRIEVGYGLEGAIPDAYAKRIVENSIVPRFRQGDFVGGLRAAVSDLGRLIEGETLPEPARRAQGDGGGSETLLAAVLAVFVFGTIAKAVAGRVIGSLAGGGAAAVASMAFWGATLGFALVVFVLAFLFFVIAGVGGGSAMHRAGRHTWRSGPPGGWGGGWGGGGGGGFGGGGGGFGGGGASGRW